MRDLDQLRERSDETTVRRLGLFVMGGAVGVAALMAFGIVLGRRPSDPPPERDPLALLGGDLAVAPGEQPEAEPAVALSTLAFPAILAGDEATIEATVQAAEAEHAALTGRADGIGRARGGKASSIPASTLAGDQASRLARTARHDPLIAAALPERLDRSPAPAGSEGAFTLQVVSYEDRAEAERFAEALRARGHRAYIAQADVPGRSRSYRVRVGPFGNRREAVEYQKRFELSERLNALVVGGSPQ